MTTTKTTSTTTTPRKPRKEQAANNKQLRTNNTTETEAGCNRNKKKSSPEGNSGKETSLADKAAAASWQENVACRAAISSLAFATPPLGLKFEDLVSTHGRRLIKCILLVILLKGLTKRPSRRMMHDFLLFFLVAANPRLKHKDPLELEIFL